MLRLILELVHSLSQCLTIPLKSISRYRKLLLCKNQKNAENKNIQIYLRQILFETFIFNSLLKYIWLSKFWVVISCSFFFVLRFLLFFHVFLGEGGNIFLIWFNFRGYISRKKIKLSFSTELSINSKCTIAK